MNEIINEFIKWVSENSLPIISLIITPFLAWFFSRKKETATVENIDAKTTNINSDAFAKNIESSGRVIGYWESYAKKQNDTISGLEVRIRNLEKMVSEKETIEKEFLDIRDQKAILEKRVDELEKFTKETIVVVLQLMDKIDQQYPVEVGNVRRLFDKYKHIIEDKDNGETT